jgi:hypothetical protein
MERPVSGDYWWRRNRLISKTPEGDYDDDWTSVWQVGLLLHKRFTRILNAVLVFMIHTTCSAHRNQTTSWGCHQITHFYLSQFPTYYSSLHDVHDMNAYRAGYVSPSVCTHDSTGELLDGIWLNLVWTLCHWRLPKTHTF